MKMQRVSLSLIGLLCSSGLSSVGWGAEGDKAARESGGLEEIVVTAQKRTQNLQDVPIAVTAFTEDAIKLNRVTNVYDISALAPNLTVQKTAGGAGVATFAIRGITSQGTVAGQDKSINVYVDGVQIAAGQGSVFDIPTITRVEVLRGPQGTLFGRNATAGAISIVTPEPSGEAGFHQQLTAGNYSQFRSTTTIDLPSKGSFSAYLAYTHDQRDGEIKNLGAGTVWNRTAGGFGTATSPKTLGDKDSNAYFVAVKYAPSDTFKAVYKYDKLNEDNTPDGMGLVSLQGSFIGAVANNVGTAIFAGVTRPDAVNNAWVVPGKTQAKGHNLTMDWGVSDRVRVKSITGYRETYLFGSAQMDGFGGFTRNGVPATFYASAPEATSEQFSEELQLNYSSDPLTVTAGAVYYNVKAVAGGANGGRMTLSAPSFALVPGGAIPGSLTNYIDRNQIHNKSYAGFAQAEFHLTPQVDLVGGLRWTKDDKKTTSWVTDARGTRVYTGTYNKSEPTYLAGVNYRLSDDVLLYAKYSTGFVAGGVLADLPYTKEEVKAWEAGAKADFLDGRLRTNVALFKADYKNVQKTTTGNRLAVPRLDLPLIITNEGDVPIKGIEAEVSALVGEKLTLSAGLGYSDYKLENVNPLLFAANQSYFLAFRGKSTANLAARFLSNPLFGDARLSVNIDGSWHDKVRMVGRLPIPAGHESIEFSPAIWTVNARVALMNIAAAHGGVEVGLWARNLFDQDAAMWTSSIQSISASTTYERARTFGLDVIFDFN